MEPARLEDVSATPALALVGTPYITPSQVLTPRGMDGYLRSSDQLQELTYVGMDTFLATL